MTTDGTSYENVKQTIEALTGSWSNVHAWTVTWAPSLRFSELELTISGPDQDGDIAKTTNVFDMPAEVLELVVELRRSFDRWKSGEDYCFHLPRSLRKAKAEESAPALTPEEVLQTNEPLNTSPAAGADPATAGAATAVVEHEF